MRDLEGSKAQLIRFKGFTVSKEEFEKKYNVELSELEWKIVSNSAAKEWEERVLELRNLAFRCIKSSMNSVGYKTELNGKDIVFKKPQD